MTAISTQMLTQENVQQSHLLLGSLIAQGMMILMQLIDYDTFLISFVRGDSQGFKSSLSTC